MSELATQFEDIMVFPHSSRFYFNKVTTSSLLSVITVGGWVLPYMPFTGRCRWMGYGFLPLCPEQGVSRI